MLQPGFLTTVQDRGRFGYQRYGIPASGAMDEASLRMANILVDNPEGAAALELTAQGPELLALADLAVVIVGAEMDPLQDGSPVPLGEVFVIRRGEVLKVQGAKRGLRAYLAVHGGFDVPLVLGSRSTCLPGRFGGFQGRALQEGDILTSGPPMRRFHELEGRRLSSAYHPRWDQLVKLRVVLGPQDDRFTQEGVETFLSSEYKVMTEADRMGYRLEGPPIAHRAGPDIVSDAIPPGAVQVPGNRQPVVLLADRQTTGGYAKIAVVIRPDLPKLAQAKPGDPLHFSKVSLGEAYEAFRAYEEGFLRLRQEVEQKRGRKVYVFLVEGERFQVEVEGKGL
ncbi:MAG: biotin-dependent carboxyltransferase family protein [candidate division NC10 bacterium]|nr:biotin-dependent carboxyltransferase family protein [candidate division NC10 bacterium]